MAAEARPLFVRLDADTAKKLEDFRWANRLSLVEIITAAVNEYIDRQHAQPAEARS